MSFSRNHHGLLDYRNDIQHMENENLAVPITDKQGAPMSSNQSLQNTSVAHVGAGNIQYAEWFQLGNILPISSPISVTS